MAYRIISSSTVLGLGLGLCAVVGCASQPTASGERSPVSRPPVETAAAPQAGESVAAELPLALTRSVHGAPMSEVVLDPRAEAALTLDVEGNVRLWTDLSASAATMPLALPAQEPGWMSLARADGAFVAGFIDTAGGASVLRIEADGDEAKASTLFEIPATDPLFELHVLDGGERILALGIDHRVRLYDAEGTELSVIDSMGFVPWQLRVQQRAGQPPAIVAVLAGPTRVQPIALRGDRLELRGEARTVEIDQGPNRNDLSLSPDGSTVVAMRRPRARKRRFTFELVDLETNARRLVAVESDTRDRPRVLAVDEQRLLLETGSGMGYWLDLSAAVPWTVGTTREETEDVPQTEMTPVHLPGSTTPRRMHATVVAGVRAVPALDTLVIDPVDEPGHVQLGSDMLRARAVAMSEDGTQVAWASNGQIVIDAGGSEDQLRSFASPGWPVEELAFIDEHRLLVLDGKGNAQIVDDQAGQVVSSTKIRADWGPAAGGFRRGESFGEGIVAILPARPKQPLRVVDVGDGAFGEPRDVPRWERTQWPSLGTGERDSRGVIAALGFDALPADSIGALVEDSGGHHVIVADSIMPTLFVVSESGSRSIPLREGGVRRVVPEPEGTRVAVLQRVRRGTVVSVYDTEAEQRLWSRVAKDIDDLEWSSDGGRLAVAAHEGGWVLDGQTGEDRLVRRHLGFSGREVQDEAATDL